MVAFDAAYATESLEHAMDIEKAVAEMCRVVRPGGRIVIIDKNAEHWGKLETPAWEKWFHRRELEKLLGRHCGQVSSDFISYWEDVPPDGLFSRGRRSASYPKEKPWITRTEPCHGSRRSAGPSDRLPYHGAHLRHRCRVSGQIRSRAVSRSAARTAIHRSCG